MQHLGDYIGNKCTFLCFYVLSLILSKVAKKTAWPNMLVIYQGKHRRCDNQPFWKHRYELL